MKIKGEIDMEYRERRPEVEIDLKEIMGLILHNTTIIILATTFVLFRTFLFMARAFL